MSRLSKVAAADRGRERGRIDGEWTMGRWDLRRKIPSNPIVSRPTRQNSPDNQGYRALQLELQPEPTQGASPLQCRRGRIDTTRPK